MNYLKRKLVLHVVFLGFMFAFITLFRKWFEFRFLYFWIGGLVGTFLPDIDQLIHVFFLKPQELSSQRVKYLISKKQFLQAVALLADTRQERPYLLFHSFLFQIVFLVFAFFVITSSGNLFGRGLVLAFSLHLLVDQLRDLISKGELNNWLKDLPIPLELSKEKLIFVWLLILAFILYLGFLV